jgi:hypothetical protein
VQIGYQHSHAAQIRKRGAVALDDRVRGLRCKPCERYGYLFNGGGHGGVAPRDTTIITDRGLAILPQAACR